MGLHISFHIIFDVHLLLYGDHNRADSDWQPKGYHRNHRPQQRQLRQLQRHKSQAPPRKRKLDILLPNIQLRQKQFTHLMQTP